MTWKVEKCQFPQAISYHLIPCAFTPPAMREITHTRQSSNRPKGKCCFRSVSRAHFPNYELRACSEQARLGRLPCERAGSFGPSTE